MLHTVQLLEKCSGMTWHICHVLLLLEEDIVVPVKGLGLTPAIV